MSTSSYCHIHHEWEPVPATAYIVCRECGHVYETAVELVDDHNLDTGELLRAHDAEKILSCPGCAHDF